jgi:hypothetical protein
MTYTSGNPGPGFRQAQKCGGVKPVNGLPTLPFLIIGSPTAIQILTDINITKKTKTKKKNLHRFASTQKDLTLSKT